MSEVTERCLSCQHGIMMHYDGRGCHVENCRCVEVYNIKVSRATGKISYEASPILEKNLRYGETYLDSLWAEIKDWHGDPLKMC